MRTVGLMALLTMGLAAPAFAQHGGGHAVGGRSGGGMGGHAPSSLAPSSPAMSTPAMHSSPGDFRSAPPMGSRPTPGYASAPLLPGGYRYSRNSIPPSQRFSGYRPSGAGYPGLSPSARTSANFRGDRSRPVYSGNRGGRDGNGGNHDGRYRNRYGYGYAGYPWLGIPYLGYYGSELDYPGDYYDDSADTNNYVTQDYPGSEANNYDSQAQDGYPGPKEGVGPRAPARPYGYQDDNPQNYGPSHAVAPPPDQPVVTLIFKDGRMQQIHNYILSRNTLTILDARNQEIPVDSLDLPATENFNKEAGVNFRLPSR